MQAGFVKKEKVEVKFDKKEEEKPKTTAQLLAEVEALTKKVAHLETEIVKRDAKIKELGGN